MSAVLEDRPTEMPQFMSVRQVAQYLHLNEKKIYALLKEGNIPGTKITGKWLFPRELVDRWILDASHGGVLNDRLVVSGSDDPLLYRMTLAFAQQSRSHALVTYSPTGTRLGLELLQANRADLCALHWGPDVESGTRHPALLTQYPQHRNWVLVRLFRRRQGVLLNPRLNLADATLDELVRISHRQGLRWNMRQPGSGTQRFFIDALSGGERDLQFLEQHSQALSERDAAAKVAMGIADCTPGTEATAVEFGLDFLAIGWEGFDLALSRHIYFRNLFQELLKLLKSEAGLETSLQLRGYDLNACGRIVWSAE